MKGNIYTAEKCPLCGGKLRHSEDRSGFLCEDHPEFEVIPKKMKVRFGNEVQRRF